MDFLDSLINESTQQRIGDWFGDHGWNVLIILAVIWLLRRFGNHIITQIIRKSLRDDNFATHEDEVKREETLIDMITAILQVALYIVGGMLVVAEFGVDIGPLIAGASVLGVALGFGAQSLVKDFISGLFIIFENQYRVGDIVTIAGVSGVVTGISIRTTVLRDLDGNEHHVPNGSIDVTTNMTMDYANINMNVGVSYDADIDKVRDVINTVGVELYNDPDWHEKIIEAPAFLRVDNFGDSSVDIKILGKVKPATQWEIAGEYRRRLKVAFDKNKIEIPFPQQVMHQVKD